jgi:hypothetical protein
VRRLKSRTITTSFSVTICVFTQRLLSRRKSKRKPPDQCCDLNHAAAPARVGVPARVPGWPGSWWNSTATEACAESHAEGCVNELRVRRVHRTNAVSRFAPRAAARVFGSSGLSCHSYRRCGACLTQRTSVRPSILGGRGSSVGIVLVATVSRQRSRSALGRLQS